MAPKLGATFVPGGSDDYFMPEVLAPSPQRVMPEVPQNMQDDLQRMELEANSVGPRKDTEESSPTSIYSKHDADPTIATVLADPKPLVSSTQLQTTTSHAPFRPSDDRKHSSNLNMPDTDVPSFSPFPKIKGENVPPADDEKEEIMWNTREVVLHSNDVTMQLAWSKDTLAWVEIVMEALIRDLAGKPRPPTPNREHTLRIDALTIINYLAGQEHPEALFLRSKWLEFGRFGYRPDKREAFNGYKKAAELGFARAEYRMGMLYETSNDMRRAIEHYEKGLAKQDSAASYRLGMMSLLGQHGQLKDYKRGLELINSAADTADEDAPQGAYVFGMLIARDLPDINIPEGFLPCVLPTARRYIEKAAYYGFAKAQLKMGQAYELCQLGCDFNPSFSLHYYGLAAKQGQPEAALGVSRWFLFGYEGFFSKNEQLAFKYAQEAAAAKLATGEFAMGYYHEIGIHVQKDLREAKRWYEQAAEHGNKDAVGRLESLNLQKTLTKQDHETTTLGRIKSQHGSQRGKRPDRFKQASTMPTVSEADAQAEPTPLMKPGKPSPRQSPHASPSAGSYNATDMPDPSRLSLQANRPPAFSVNVSGAQQKPTAPYPEDDRPPPLNWNRPASTAPYPDDDAGRPPLAPHLNPAMRPLSGPQADRPMSAFGIRPLSPAGQAGRQPSPGGGVRQSQSMANLAPNDHRGRVVSAGWEGSGPGAYRQPSPGPPGVDPRRDEYRQEFVRPATTQPYEQRLSGPASMNPAHNRLQKQNPHVGKPQPPIPGQYPGTPDPRDYGQTHPAAAQPGRDYGPRVSSRPMSAAPQPTRPASDNFDRHSRVPSGNRPDRIDSLTQGRPLPFKGGPSPIEGPGRMGSAPPAQGRPQARPTPPLASGSSAPASSRPSGQGPATFEEMGIPQGKGEGDCVVM